MSKNVTATATATPATVANVKAIGKGDRLTAEVAEAVVLHAGSDFDWTKRGAVPDAIRAALGVTTETEPRQKIGAAGDQTTTDYGRGFDVLRKAVSRLAKMPEAKPVRLSVNLSGDEVTGGSVVISPDHPLFADLMALFSVGED